MEKQSSITTAPRVILSITFALIVLLWLAACQSSAVSSGYPATNLEPQATTASTQPTGAPTTAAAQLASSQPDCSNVAPLTPAMTEGPYFKAGSPERASLLQPGMSGTKLTLAGFVLTADCKPIAHALLDFWQANDKGQYDNSGYTLRGHEFTDASGQYRLETIIPGLYPGRTEHIHVKVQAPNGPILTTQLFFPGVAQNASDQIFDTKLLMSITDAGDGKLATFNFVVSAK